MSIRVYVPSTLGRLRAVVAADGLGPAPFMAHAVTEALRKDYPDGGEEEWEYAATTAAAQSSVALLHADEPARRVVLAVDVPATRPAGGADPTVVEVDEVVPFRRLAAVLADSAEAETVVARARDAVARGGPGAERLLDQCLAHELGWWAAQEAGALLGEAGLT